VTQQTDLSKKMRERADADALPASHELRMRADAFDRATADYFSTPQKATPAQFTGAWARARRVWSDYSGEPLL
jgi:predicted lipoprotein